ncbi:sigma-70 family RNA polymerase sigma factor [Pseudoponticoccus marisrubri]|uniref:RNA polymerase sigma factor n=1 Tax=Pseudoponticoccus marisrubri TaxID=1685382 RepID=A0A0W7WNU5_9RHOB|nr:sigma-70 family RNA polymerase sigma factor [Pseudoponticoccus marisrubri]KUF12255.1 RNA polymerase subunit sigma [Pseudoponticoccus marisrubri]
MSAQEEIEALIARVAMGDRKAFRTLYDRTSAKLFGIALRVLKEQGPAEEVLQEVYIRIWNRAGQYRVNGYSPMTWLITITRNAAIDRLRKARAAGVAVEPVEIAERLYDPQPGPESQSVMRDEARALQACLGELPADRAEMVRRAYLQGHTYAEIAEAAGAKLNTIRTWLRRSLMQLRECLSQ